MQPRLILAGAITSAVLGIIAQRAGGQIFVTNGASGTVGEYTLSGAPANPALVTGLSIPDGIAVTGQQLFVANQSGNTIGAYTTAGATVNPALISGLSAPG